jgi:hypothetical protein
MVQTTAFRCVLSALLGAVAPAYSAPYVDISVPNFPQSALADCSMDVEFADVDRDGDLDVLVAKEFAPNLLLLNDGNFRFTVAAGAIPGDT